MMGFSGIKFANKDDCRSTIRLADIESYSIREIVSSQRSHRTTAAVSVRSLHSLPRSCHSHRLLSFGLYWCSSAAVSHSPRTHSPPWHTFCSLRYQWWWDLSTYQAIPCRSTFAGRHKSSRSRRSRATTADASVPWRASGGRSSWWPSWSFCDCREIGAQRF
jgi:hypothetical protein